MFKIWNMKTRNKCISIKVKHVCDTFKRWGKVSGFKRLCKSKIRAFWKWWETVDFVPLIVWTWCFILTTDEPFLSFFSASLSRWGHYSNINSCYIFYVIVLDLWTSFSWTLPPAVFKLFERTAEPPACRLLLSPPRQTGSALISEKAACTSWWQSGPLPAGCHHCLWVSFRYWLGGKQFFWWLFLFSIK